AALVLLDKLATIELGPRDARSTLVLVAFFPASFFFSAIYAESLFLLLSVATLLAARQGRWAWAGVAGGLAAVTRNSGVGLLLPVLRMFLYGPGADAPHAPPGGAARGGPPSAGATRPWWRPRHRLTPQVLWLALIPAALAGYLAYSAVVFDDPFAPFSSQA